VRLISCLFLPEFLATEAAELHTAGCHDTALEAVSTVMNILINILFLHTPHPIFMVLYIDITALYINFSMLQGISAGF